MLFNQGHIFSGGANGPLAIEYVGTTTDTAGTAAGGSYTFTAASIGAASATRHVLVVLHHRSNGTTGTGSCTLGGNAMTQLGRVESGQAGVSAYLLKLTTGTTADIVATQQRSQQGIAMSVFIITGADIATLLDVDFSLSGSPSWSMTATVDGCALGCVTRVQAAACTWTGLTSESYDNVNIEDIFYRYAAIGLTDATTETIAHNLSNVANIASLGFTFKVGA